MSSEKIKLIYNSDYYWDKTWNKIDKAQKRICIVTYDMDNKMVANLTMLKLIEAASRGVKVILIVEYINFFMKHSLIKRLKSKGGIVIKPNPVIDNFMKLRFRKAFNRYHQKVTLIDNDLFIGSINISDQYTFFKYGSFDFIDLNLYLKNTPCAEKVYRFFRRILEENKRQVKDIVDTDIDSDIDSDRDNSGHNINAEEEFVEERPPMKTDIQDKLCEMLESAQDTITLIQSYYLNIKKIEDILLRALKRGVKVQIITAGTRDQQVYKYIFNEHLFDTLLKNGATVYEYLDKSFHMKAYYVDNKYLTLGSFNNDFTSFWINNEANYVIKKNVNNIALFVDVNKMIKEIKDNCREVKHVDLQTLPKRRLYVSYFFLFGLWLMKETMSIRR